MFEVMAELEAVCGRLAAIRISDQALTQLYEANAQCRMAVETADTNRYYAENEAFHRIIYRQSGNSFLEQEAIKLHKRLKPFRRRQLRCRGRMPQSMAEHEAIVGALTEGNSEAASSLLRDHVAVQGKKFQHLMATIRDAAE